MIDSGDLRLFHKTRYGAIHWGDSLVLSLWGREGWHVESRWR
jgi:hypothetical protein